jgi:hypothetical protein
VSLVADAVEAELARQRERGCVCEAEATVLPHLCLAHWPPRVHLHLRVLVGHDVWCPLPRSRETYGRPTA